MADRDPGAQRAFRRAQFLSLWNERFYLHKLVNLLGAGVQVLKFLKLFPLRVLSGVDR